MIKVKGVNFPVEDKPKFFPKLFNLKLLRSIQHRNQENTFINFSTDDFMGINQKFRMLSGENSITVHKSLSDYNLATTALERIFKKKFFIFPDETKVYQQTLPEIIKSNDIIVVDEFVNPIIKLAINQLEQNDVFVLKHNTFDKLREVLGNQQNTNRKIWFVAQSIYPVPGSEESLNTVKQLLAKYSQLYLFIDDSYGLSWTGQNGRGIVTEHMSDLKKTIVVASLTKGFGAEEGAIAVTEMEGTNFMHSITEPLLTWNFQSFHHSLTLHSSGEINFLQKQLKETINYYQSLIKGELPCLSNPNLPVSFLAAGLPEICRDVCYSVLKEGFYVSSAVFPHASVNQPGIKVSINLGHTKEQIKDMVNALKNAYTIALKKRNKNLTKLFEIQN